MTPSNLVNRLSFDERNVLLDGEAIYSFPEMGYNASSKIKILGVPQHGKKIYVGSGICCHGLIAILNDSNSREEEKPHFSLGALRLPSFNVEDILPVVIDYDKTGFKKTRYGRYSASDDAILTTGHGCSGSGVSLVSIEHPKTIEVVSEKEYDKMRCGVNIKPRFRFEGRGIILDFFKRNEYECITSEVTASTDLTPLLNELGIDIGKTIQENSGYARIRDQIDCIVYGNGYLEEVRRIKQNHNAFLGITDSQIDLAE